MSGVDDRVVSMEFDNAAFQARTAETMKSLDQLKASLDFANENRNLSSLENAGRNFSLGPIGNAVEGVSGKFLAMATVGITALSNITNKAVNAGEQLLKSFTLDPITQGFDNFSNKMTSISTILANTASKGTQLPDVEASLANLNTYANQTIYDFAGMTQNLGTFTAAGVDLKTSQEAIKGIANVAAISGSNTEQASTAMYQLSQAMASGQVHLQDWNSVVNAGMGGQVFQKALFDTGVALKAIPNVPVGTTFEDWTKKGNSFRDSLQDGWLTTKVLTTTLNSFSGDFNAAQLKQLGYSDQQAKAMEELGQNGLKAATQIKSLRALMDMLKENTAAGWAQTFTVLTGSYDQAVGLFTDIGNALGGIVQSSSDARNKLLEGWAALGGREALIQGFKNAIKALTDVFGVLKSEFRTVFPAETSKQLFDTTQMFEALTAKLIPSQGTLQKIKLAFDAVFYALDIGKEVVKGVIGVFETLIGNIFGRLGAGGGALDLLDKLGVAMINLDNFLVGEGRIQAFFMDIDHAIAGAFEWILKMSAAIEKFFKSGDPEKSPTNKTLRDFGEVAGSANNHVNLLEMALGRLEERYKAVASVFSTNSEAFKFLDGMYDRISHVLDLAGNAIHKWFSELGANIAASIKPGDFDAGVDAVNVGLLGGIVLMLHKFMDLVKSLDLSGGIMDSIKETLEGVKGQLKAMQTELKAKALEEIAIALGVLTASILVLSLIDSAKLTKAMTALGVGMEMLVQVMKQLDNVAEGSKDAAKFAVLATGMTLMATAALILSGAVALLAQLSWEELAKGLLGVTAILGVMVGVSKLMEGNAIGMVAAGLAMVPLATGITILAGAVEVFGHMSWETMAHGLIGLAAALGIVVAVMQVMPFFSLLAAGAAMIPLATGISILAGAIMLFGLMSWESMAKGLTGLAGALVIIALAMQAMPLTLPITAAGLVLVGVALSIMAGAMKLFATMNWGDIARGLTVVAGLMVILTVAVNLMSGALGGAAAMVVVAGALSVLSKVLIELSKLNWLDIAKGLAAIAGVFLVLGVAGLVLGPIIPELLGLGIAMTLVGAGFALFGVGAIMVSKAIEALALAGKVGIRALIDTFDMLLAAIPRFISTLVSSLMKSSGDIFNSAQLMLNIMTVLLVQILETVIKLAPEIAGALVAIISSALVLIRAEFPNVANTALDLLIVLLTTIRNHMPEVVQLAIDIVVALVTTLTANAWRLINTAVDLLLAMLSAIANRAGDIVGAGLNIILALLSGLLNNVSRLIDFAVSVVIALAYTVGVEAVRLVRAGADLIIQLAQGVADNVYRIADKAVDIVLAFLNALGAQALRLANGAADALTNFLNGLATAIRDKSEEINAAGRNVASAIIDGIANGLVEDVNVGKVVNRTIDLAKKAYKGFMDFIEGHSPSKLFERAAGFIAQGVALGLDNDTMAEASAADHAQRIVDAFQATINKIPDSLAGMDEFNSPTITPVLDLSKVHAGARTINDLMSGTMIAPEVSTDQARLISTTAELAGTTRDPLADQRPSQVTFNQYNNSPTALSTNDIFKQTNSAIAKAKEELNI